MTRRTNRSWLTTGALLAVSAAFMTGCTQFTDLTDLVAQLADQSTSSGGATGGNEVELPRPNIPPAASAGDDVSAVAGETVYLDGSRSSDADGDNLRIFWSQIEGEPVVEINSPFASVASFDAPAEIKVATTLKFRITVIDGHIATTDDVTVVITP